MSMFGIAQIGPVDIEMLDDIEKEMPYVAISCSQ